MKTLWSFQAEDVSAFEEVKSVGLGYDMGTGKTFTSIERDARIRRAAWKAGLNNIPPTLIIAPKSTLEDTWLRELTDYYGNADRVYVIDLKKQPARARELFIRALVDKKAIHYVIHWQAIPLLVDELRKHDIRFLHVIADEAQYIKNRKAKVSVATKRIPCLWKTALSGTFADDKPADWWSILNWLYPKQFSSFWQWSGHYLEKETAYGNGGQTFQKTVGIKPYRLEEFHEELAPFYRQHLKRGQCCDNHPNGVFPDMPPVVYTTRTVDLTPQQRRGYNDMRDNMIAWVEKQEAAGRSIEEPLIASSVVAMLQRLQQFALANMEFAGTKVVEKDGELVEKSLYRMTEPSSKLDLLMEIIDACPGQIVVFSQFRQIIDLLEVRLQSAGIGYGVLTGAVDTPTRTRHIQNFTAGRTKAIVGTIAAGGTGINLQTASTMVFLDRAWSPSKNAQAEARVDRAGQRSTVQIIDLMAKDTIDFGRAQKIERKWKWVKEALTHPRFLVQAQEVAA